MRWKRVIALLTLLLAFGIGFSLLVVRLEREAPSLDFDEQLQFVGRETAWNFVAGDARTGLRQVRVWVSQGPKTVEVYAKDFPSPGLRAKAGVHIQKVSLTFDPKKLGLSDGAATIYVAALDNSLWGLKGNSTFHDFSVTVDTLPPRADLLSSAHNIKKGGTGLVVFRLSEVPESAGVTIGETFFPAYPEESAGEGVYLAYFAVSHDAADGVVPVLTALDRAGNEVRRTVPARIFDSKFRRDTIRLSDGFLRRKVPEFQALDPGLDRDLLKAYLTVNREWRKQNHERLREICSESHPQRLWSGSFVQMKNTQNMSSYAVRRSYLYNGRPVDTQVHLGLDLASTAGAAVPAANTGIVAMAGELGIYGQTVILDHGQGLFSLYSHLSGILVTEGETVARGQEIGTSGQSGMAGGDHLHFSILVSGEFVNPVEWLDGHWIADNIESKLALVGSPPGR